MTSERNANMTQGETEGADQEPTQVGDADPAVRDPRPVWTDEPAGRLGSGV